MESRQQQHRSTAQLVRDVVADVVMLLRQEVALARAEMREELARVFVALALLAVALATLGVAGLWMLIAATRGIAELFGWSLAAVYAAVGSVLGLIGLALLAVVWRQIHRLRVLPKTRETLREQVQWTARRAGETVP